MFTVLNLIINLAVIALWLYIAMYLVKLEKIGCDCAKGWQHDFIKYYIIVLILTLLLSAVGINTSVWPAPLAFLLFAAFVTFVVVVFLYLRDLKTCKCAQDKAKTVFEIINYIQMALLALVILFSFGILTFVAGSSSKRRYRK